MKPSQVLRKAKKVLWDGRGKEPNFDDERQQFICNAVHAVTDDFRLGMDVTNHIESLLDGDTVEVWLTKQGYIRGDLYLPLPTRTQVQVQKYRKRWMNHLIKQYEEQGL